MNRTIERRTFLVLGGASAGLVAFACAGCQQQTVAEATGAVSAGKVADVAVDSLQVLGGGSLVLARDQQGLYAMSAVCTHAGCGLDAVNNKTSGGLNCPCHGSTFAANGVVTAGPARSALAHFAVEVDATGAITVRADLPHVSQDTRTPVS